jgi:tRNA G18 (ribose-2'-O)-methylase SpoU
VPFELSRDISTTIRKLQAQGFTVFALEQTTDSIQLPDLKLPLNAKVALLLGEEVEGIDEELVKICDQALEIPMFGRKESFNVSVATGIALYKIACE